ncbi:hypothetical protein [Spirosoma harenae]
MKRLSITSPYTLRGRYSPGILSYTSPTCTTVSTYEIRPFANGSRRLRKQRELSQD